HERGPGSHPHPSAQPQIALIQTYEASANGAMNSPPRRPEARAAPLRRVCAPDLDQWRVAMRHVTALTLLLSGFIIAPAPANAELFQRHADRKIWKYDGGGQCSATVCPGWTRIDQNPATQDIVAGYGGLYR